jgi:hypothetical protein
VVEKYADSREAVKNRMLSELFADEPDLAALLSCIARGPEDPETQRLWQQLEQKLLAIGGKRVSWQGRDVDLARLVQHGRLFTEPVRRKPGERSNCHGNAARLWIRDSDITQLVTGYGLSPDGLWCQHSWIVQNGILYETTVKRTHYYGMVLEDGKEAVKFWISNSPRDIFNLDPKVLRKRHDCIKSLLRESLEPQGYGWIFDPKMADKVADLWAQCPKLSDN